MESSPVVDVPVNLNTVWTGPDGFIAANSSYPVETNHTTTIVINSFKRNESGIYICTADFRSLSTFYHMDSNITSDSVQVTTGEIAIATITDSGPGIPIFLTPKGQLKVS